MAHKDRSIVSSQQVGQHPTKAKFWKAGSLFLLWLLSTPGFADEICHGIDTKSFTAPIAATSTCTVTGNISVGPDVTVADDVALYGSSVGFTGPVTIQGRLRVAKTSYQWASSPWSECQGDCGGNAGIMTRDVWCEITLGSMVVLDSYCNTATKPATSQSCTTQQCVTPGRLNDTGILACGDAANNNLSCPLTGFPDQDAQHGRDVTHNNNSDGHAGFGFTQQGTECVKDNVTGLTWEVKTNDGGLHDKDDRYNWYNTDATSNGGHPGYADDDGAICSGYNSGDSATFCNTQAYVARVNQAGWCGYNDWRLPTIKELEGIASQDRVSPTIDSDYFPNTVSSNYWSASPYAGISNYAWYVYFNYGYSNYGNKGNHDYVRLVRSGQ